MPHRHFAGQPVRSEIVRFVSVLSKRPRSAPSLPTSLPATGTWLLRILAREDRFVFGVYRRQMRAIGYLGEIDRLYGVPATTRNWNTITKIARVLGNKQGRPLGNQSLDTRGVPGLPTDTPMKWRAFGRC